MRLTNYNAAAAKLVPLAFCIVVPLAAFVARKVAPDTMTTMILLVAAVAIAPIALIPALVMPFFAVFWIDVGEELAIRKLFGTKRVAWSDVKGVQRVRSESQLGLSAAGPGVTFATHEFLAFELANGKSYRVKVTPDELVQVERRLAEARAAAPRA